MPDPVRLVQTDVDAVPGWLQRPLTGKRAVMLTIWWLMAVILPVFAVVVGLSMGALTGAAGGAAKGVAECYRDLRLWWRTIERTR